MSIQLGKVNGLDDSRGRLSSALALLCVGIGVAVPAQAKDAGRAAGEATPLSEVVVTARMRAENLQTVPAAVSLVSAEWLDRSNTVNTQQLAQLVPTVYYNSANPRNTAYTIRGLGSNTLSISAANDGIEPGVGFYVDGVYHARPATAAFDFTDIERVEVLRGPQGTLFGKNTTAGAIHIISREPDFQPDARVELAAGNNAYVQAKAAINGGLTDHIAGRLAVQLTRRDGVIHNVRTNQDLNELNNTTARGQLLFVANDALKLRLIADVSDLNSVCCAQVFWKVGQSQRSAARQYPALAAGLGYSPPSQNVYDRLSDIDADLKIKTRDGGLALLADWQFDRVALTSISAWRYWDWDVANDRDYTGLPIQLLQRIPSRQDQYSQELRAVSQTHGPLSWVAGLYLFNQTITGNPLSVYGPTAAYWLLNPTNFTVAIPSNLLDGYAQTGRSRYRLNSVAAYGEANYALTAALTATLGLRYTYEDKTGNYATQVSGGLDLSGLPTTTATELNRAKLSIFRPQSYDAHDAGGNVSGRANLAWQWDAQRMTYLGLAYGYKSGGLNMSGLPLDAQNQPALGTAVIKDEKNQTIELGFKSAWSTANTIVNLAVFHTRVDNFQANIVSSAETAALRSYPANVPQVTVKGAEVDVSTQPARALAMRASVAYALGEYANYPAGPCPLEVQTAATVACNLTGVDLAGLSRWVGTLSVDYRQPWGTGKLIAHTDWQVRSRYNSDTSGSQYTWISGYGVVNASVGYEFAQRIEVLAFARNLFDANYLTALTIQTGNSGLILAQPSDPRMVGLQLRAHF